MTSFRTFISDRENIILEYLINLEQVEIYHNRSNVMKIMKIKSVGDSSSSNVQDTLKTIR